MCMICTLTLHFIYFVQRRGLITGSFKFSCNHFERGAPTVSSSFCSTAGDCSDPFSFGSSLSSLSVTSDSTGVHSSHRAASSGEGFGSACIGCKRNHEKRYGVWRNRIGFDEYYLICGDACVRMDGECAPKLHPSTWESMIERQCIGGVENSESGVARAER